MIRSALAITGAFTLLVAGNSWATLTNVDSASDVCPDIADPCIVDQTVEVTAGATLDFGSRTLRIQGAGLIDVGAGVATIRCGRLISTVSDTAVSLAGPSPSGGTDGGVLTVEARRQCSGNTSVSCIRDNTCAAQGAGTCTAGNTGEVDIAGKILGTSDSPGDLTIRAAGNVTISSPIHMDGSSIESDGGTVELDSAGTLVVDATITATAGATGSGGDIDLTADVDAIVNEPLDATGGDFDGGIIQVFARRDVLMVEDVSASSAAGGGFGGEVAIDAYRDISLAGGTSSNRQLLAADGHTSFDNFAGDGGTHEYSAARNLTVGQYVRITSDGAGPDGYGDGIFLTAYEDATIAGELRASSVGVQGGGGAVEIDATGRIQITATARLDVTGAGGGGGDAVVSAAGQLDFDGTADASAGNGGLAGSLELEGGDQMFIRGDVLTSGAKVRTYVGPIDVAACRIDMLSGALIDNSAEGGTNRFVAREHIEINSGASVLARGVSGSNTMTYRSTAKPPGVHGTVAPFPAFVVQPGLPPCPVCGNREVDGGETCDDGNTVDGDGCSAQCQDEGCIADTPGWPGVGLCDDGDGCSVDSCNTTLHRCANLWSCDDGIGCTDDSCQVDVCVHTPNDSLCTGNPCGDGVCSATAGCVYVPHPGPCNDGLFCNGTDECADGACSVHAGNPCLGAGVCANVCNESTDACSPPEDKPCADDGNSCTADSCDAAGQCTHPPNNLSCDDGLFCNGADTCSAGTCSVHAGDPCTTQGECRDFCDEANRACQTPAGTPCSDDGNMCTPDECSGAGWCSHLQLAYFVKHMVKIKREEGAANDHLLISATFPLWNLAQDFDETGFSLELLDAAGGNIYGASVPATNIVDLKGDGRLFRFTDKKHTVASANGIFSAIFKRDTRRGRVIVKLKGSGHDIPGAATSNMAIAMLLGADPAADTCLSATYLYCVSKGSQVICGR